eukprot:scaffold529108_cov34-Prasinocladus_malaysianus.AAC.1
MEFIEQNKRENLIICLGSPRDVTIATGEPGALTARFRSVYQPRRQGLASFRYASPIGLFQA